MQHTPHSVGRVMTHSATSSICYVIAQAVNFGLQLLLLQAFGALAFGSVGVAQITLASLIFIAELGVPSYFIREAALRGNWGRQWQQAVWLRLTFIALAAIGLVLGWQHYYPPQDAGFGYVIGALPALFMSALNPTPLLIATGRVRVASLALLVQTGIASLLVMAAVMLEVPHLSLAVGAAFSFGYGVSVLYLRRHQPQPEQDEKNIPLTRWLRSSMTVWLSAVSGTLYTLLLTFLLQQLAPLLLPYFVIGNQVMQGISGINLQVQRVLLAAFASHHGTDGAAALLAQIYGICGRAALALMLGLLGVIMLYASGWKDAVIVTELSLISLIMAEWLLGILCSFLSTRLMAQHQERFVCRVLVSCYGGSALLQLACVALLPGMVVPVLLLRLLTMLLIITWFYRTLAVRLSPVPIAGAMVMVLLAALPPNPQVIMAVGLLAIGVSLRLCLSGWRQYRMIAHAS